MLVHGGGNAWWNFLRQLRALSADQHMILRTLDRDGEEYKTADIPTEDSSDKILAYRGYHCNKTLFALCGISLGGYIVMELLTQRSEIAKKAAIGGNICYPQPAMAYFSLAAIGLCCRLIFSKRACLRQKTLMYCFLP